MTPNLPNGKAEQSVSRQRAVATAAMVNRTHRIVRERAQAMAVRKKTLRSLWIPLALSGGLLAVFIFAAWSVLAEFETSGVEVMPDASQQMMVLLMWCVPVSAAVLAVVWFRRMNPKSGNGF